MKIFHYLFSFGFVTPIFTHTIVYNVDIIKNKYTLSEKFFHNITKRTDNDDEYTKIANQCINTLNKYEGCLMESELEIINLNSYCYSYNDDKCQRLLSEGTKSIPACRDTQLQSELSDFDTYLVIVNFYKKYHCAKDEKGNYCPFNLMDVESRRIGKDNNNNNNNNGNVQPEKDFFNYVEETCQSRKCTNTFLHYNEDYDDLIKIIDEHNEQISMKTTNQTKRMFEASKDVDQDSSENMRLAIQYLKSNECNKIYDKTAQQQQQQRGPRQSKFFNDSTNSHKCNIYLTFFIIILSTLYFIY